jgi:hypothetical protein
MGPYAKSQMGYDLLAATLIYDGHNALSDAIRKILRHPKLLFIDIYQF